MPESVNIKVVVKNNCDEYADLLSEALKLIDSLLLDLERFQEASQIALSARNSYGALMPIDIFSALEPLRHAYESFTDG